MNANDLFTLKECAIVGDKESAIIADVSLSFRSGTSRKKIIYIEKGYETMTLRLVCGFA